MGRPPCTRWCTGDIVVRVNRQNPSGLADARPPPLMGRLSRGRSPRKKAPHQGSWPSLRGLRGSARYHLLQKLLACCKLRRQLTLAKVRIPLQTLRCAERPHIFKRVIIQHQRVKRIAVLKQADLLAKIGPEISAADSRHIQRLHHRQRLLTLVDIPPA